MPPGITPTFYACWPFDAFALPTQPSSIESSLAVPQGKHTALTFYVAADDRGDWELRVSADDKLVKKQIIDRSGERWKRIEVDLTPFAGKTVALKLENAANDWTFEFGYWADIQLISTTSTAQR